MYTPNLTSNVFFKDLVQVYTHVSLKFCSKAGHKGEKENMFYKFFF